MPSTPSESVESTCYGYLIVCTAVFVLSFDALLIEQISNLTEWTIIFYRYSLLGISILVYLIFSEGSKCTFKVLYIGCSGLFAGLLLGGAGITYIFALLNTHVANVFVIMALSPLIAGFFSFILFGERFPLRIIITTIICLVSVIAVICTELYSSFDSDWFGNCSALASAFLTAGYFVIIRGVNKSRELDHQINFLPCLVVASIFEGMIALSNGADLTSITAADSVYIILQGLLVLPIGMALMTVATKYIPATELTLFSLLDYFLEPLWVALAGLDTPPLYSLIAGSIVLVTLFGNGILAIYDEKEGGRNKSYQPIPEPGPDRESNPALDERNPLLFNSI